MVTVFILILELRPSDHMHICEYFNLCSSRKYFTPSHKRTKSAGFHPPRPSPTSPTLTDYQKRMLWKKRFASTPDIRDQNATKQVSAVGVHELYDADELQQDWPDVYITSAYLVWCPSTKVLFSVYICYYYPCTKNRFRGGAGGAVATPFLKNFTI